MFLFCVAVDQCIHVVNHMYGVFVLTLYCFYGAVFYRSTSQSHIILYCYKYVNIDDSLQYIYM